MNFLEHPELIKLTEERELWRDRKNYLHLKEALTRLPSFEGRQFLVENGVVKVNTDGCELTADSLQDLAKEFGPWRKGPFQINDVFIDSEWRSDLKWDRLKKSLPRLEGKTVLDIGCNNGYFMFRMLEHNPKFVLGIDPVVPFDSQFQFINHFVQADNLKFKMWGVEHLAYIKESFDVIFSMGILYHHRNPIQQLLDIKDSLVSGGELILETIGIPGEEDYALTPKDKYARMGNVWFVPTLSCLINWLDKTKYTNIEVISQEWDETTEQRTTEWSGKYSYSDSIESKDTTIEGYPAPKRFLLKAKKK